MSALSVRLLLLGHLVGAIAFYANLLGAWLLYLHTRGSRDPGLLARVFEIIERGDRRVMPASVVMVVATGIAAAAVAGIPLGTGWILWSIAALSASGLVFALRVAGLQRALAARARQGAATGDWDAGRFERETAVWARWAGTSTLLAIVPLVLMVVRP